MDQTRIIYAATALQKFDMMDGLEPEDYIEREEDAFSVYEKLEREQLLALADVGLLTNNYITIDTYANIFSDEPDAGRMILPATSSLNIFA
ncbi:hypothetical protein E4U35_003086 [Claviceps purpurea]|nr:hypothetical protein E4U35_003086 [Claviceps purpurea]